MKLNEYNIIVLTMFLSSFVSLSAQTKKICLEIKNKKYDRLYIEGTIYQSGIGLANRLVTIPGNSDNGYNWIFNIPDTIDQAIRYYNIKYRPYDFTTGTDYYLGFSSTFDNKEFYTREFVYDPQMPVFRLEYEKTITDELGFYIVGDTITVDNAKIVQDVCKLDIDINGSQIEPIFKHPDFGIFSFEEERYNEDLNNSISIAKQYPYSKYLLGSLAYFKGSYKRKSDVKKIFDILSDGNKQSHLGNNIKEYLKFDPSFFDLDNDKLIPWNTPYPEPIIIDSSKYTLIIFSASWCSPCHKRIPLLKEIYEEKSQEMNMVYISIDQESTLSAWSVLMKKEKIPWRSLLLLNDQFGIREKYHVSGVPYMILVHPSGKAMVVDLWDSKDKANLYEKIIW